MQRVECLKAKSVVVNEDHPEGVQAAAYARPEVITMSNVGEVIRGASGRNYDGCGTYHTDQN